MKKMRALLGRGLYEIVKYLPPSTFGFLGKLCKALRAKTAKEFIRYCGRNVNIEHGAIISSSLSIGDNSGVGIDCNCSGDLTIGRDVMMGPECVIFSRNHEFKDTEQPMRLQGYQAPGKCVIGDDVWIGRRVLIMPNVKIGSHSIIGAGAVVTKDVPEWAIVAGNPAVVKKFGKEIPTVGFIEKNTEGNIDSLETV